MNYLEYLKQTWQLLENSQFNSRDYRVRESDKIKFPSGRLLFAVDEQRRRHVLVPVPDNFKVHEDRKSSGVQILGHKLLDDSNLRNFLDLICLKPDLNELFSIVVSEMLEELEADSSKPDHTCQQVLNRWRDLLAATPSGKPSLEVLIGLFGELWHLREIIRLNPASLACWTGPARTRHDFVKNNLALEVKTSRSRQGRFVEIHGYTQLEAPIGGELYLATLKLEETTGTGESLTSLVESIISLGANRAVLLNLLNTAGISPFDLALCAEPVFRVVEDRFYHVDAGFPRIISASFVDGKLPAGIVKLDYQLDLTGEPPYPLSAEKVNGIYHSLAFGD